MKFRKRPIVVDAVQVRWSTWAEVCDVLGDMVNAENPGRSWDEPSESCGENGPPWIELAIKTAEGCMIARHGDWIIKGIAGELYPVRLEIFAATYEPVEEP